jgi:predicted transcriptional regulator
MGIIWDLVKEVPLSGVLKEKILGLDAKLAESETKITLLEGDLRQANMQIKQLGDDNRRLIDQINASLQTEQPLNEMAYQVLLVFNDAADSILKSHIFRTLQTDAVSIRYYLDELKDQGFIKAASFDLDTGPEYRLTQKGRKYLMDNR